MEKISPICLVPQIPSRKHSIMPIAALILLINATPTTSLINNHRFIYSMPSLHTYHKNHNSLLINNMAVTNVLSETMSSSSSNRRRQMRSGREPLSSLDNRESLVIIEKTKSRDRKTSSSIPSQRRSQSSQSNIEPDDDSTNHSILSVTTTQQQKITTKPSTVVSKTTRRQSIRRKKQPTSTISTTTSTKKTSNNIPISRSSTMPGFQTRGNTHNARSHDHGVEIFENRSGRKLKSPTSLERKQRTTRHSRDMYVNSATVPDSLIHFVDQIHKEDRITPVEEITLGTKTREAIKIQELYENLASRYGREPTDDEWCAAAGKINMEALRQTIDEGREAKNKLVTSNLRMVQRVVNLYIRNGLGPQYNAGDLMQEGIIALIRAAEKYEPERGFRFSTYAMYWIRASVKRSQIVQSRTIDIPQRFHETYKKIQRTARDLEQCYGDDGRETTRRRPVSTAELAAACSLTEVQLERCVLAMKQRVYSLDAELTNHKKPMDAAVGSGSVASGLSTGTTMYDRIENKCDEEEFRPIEERFMKDDLVKTLRQHLNPREVDILLLRYGLMDERTAPYGFSGPLTYSEVSRLVGMKPDKVRRVINNSLKVLKQTIAHEWEAQAV